MQSKDTFLPKGLAVLGGALILAVGAQWANSAFSPAPEAATTLQNTPVILAQTQDSPAPFDPNEILNLDDLTELQNQVDADLEALTLQLAQEQAAVEELRRQLENEWTQRQTITEELESERLVVASLTDLLNQERSATAALDAEIVQLKELLRQRTPTPTTTPDPSASQARLQQLETDFSASNRDKRTLEQRVSTLEAENRRLKIAATRTPVTPSIPAACEPDQQICFSDQAPQQIDKLRPTFNATLEGDGSLGLIPLDDRFVLNSDMMFKSGSSRLSAKGQKQLKKIAVSLKQAMALLPEDQPDWVLRLEGHADKQRLRSRKHYQNNLDLSMARARRIVEFLTKQDIPQQRLMAAGFGSARPLNDGQTRADLAKNRRVELRLVSR